MLRFAAVKAFSLPVEENNRLPPAARNATAFAVPLLLQQPIASIEESTNIVAAAAREINECRQQQAAPSAPCLHSSGTCLALHHSVNHSPSNSGCGIALSVTASSSETDTSVCVNIDNSSSQTIRLPVVRWWRPHPLGGEKAPVGKERRLHFPEYYQSVQTTA